MELIIYSPSDKDFIQEIKFNHEELKAEISKALDKYRGQIYTPEQIKDAKADRAKLNNFLNALKTKRIELKKQCLKPYDEFEAKLNEIIKLIDYQVNEIDSQVKGFEETSKAEKKLILLKHFELLNKFGKIITFDKIFDPHWLNATYPIDKAKLELQNILVKIEDDLNAIESVETDFRPQMRAKYYETLNLSSAIQENLRLKELQEQEEEYISKKMNPAKYEDPEILEIKFKVFCTKAQLAKLKTFLINEKIKYGAV